MNTSNPTKITSNMDTERHALAPIELVTSTNVTFDGCSLRKNLQSRGARSDSEVISISENEEVIEKSIDEEPVLESVSEPVSEPSSEKEEVDGIVSPKDNDILSGRGAGVNLHPGNTFFRKLIKENKPKYVEEDPGEKKRMIKRIVAVAMKHGRFLKENQESGLWFEISHDEVKKKTGQALRENAPIMKRIHKEKEATNKRKLAISHLASITNFLPSELEAMSATTAPMPRSNISLSVPVPPRAPQSQSQPQSQPLSQLNQQIRNGMNVMGSTNFGFPTQIPNQHLTSVLWSRMGVLSEQQKQLKRKQQEIEDEQITLMQYISRMSAANTISSSLSPPLAPPLSAPSSPLEFYDTVKPPMTFDRSNGDQRQGKKMRITLPGH